MPKRKRGDGFGPSDATIDKINDAIANGANQIAKKAVGFVGNKVTNFIANKAGQAASNFVDSGRKETATTMARKAGGSIHCLKCKKQTANKGKPTHHTTQRGGSMLKTACRECGTTKCRFIKKGSGFLDDAWGSIKGAATTAAPYVETVVPDIPYVGSAYRLGTLVKSKL